MAAFDLTRNLDGEAPVIEYVDGGTALVFGLRWFPIIGSRIDTLARKRAREVKASHYVYGGTRAAAVGCTCLRQRLGPCYAAAQLFAHAHPEGTAAALLVLDDGRAWLAASQDGAVMARTDRIYASEALARQAWSDLAARHIGLHVEPQRLDLPALAAALDPAAALWRVGGMFGCLPAPVRVVAAVLCLAVSAAIAWQAGGTRQPVARAADQAIDDAQAWRGALSTYANHLPMHSAAQLGDLFGSLRRLPIQVRGWALRAAHCRPGAADWACSARYARVAPAATNGDFAAALPVGMQPAFRQLDEAEMTWRVPARAATLDPGALPRASETDVVLAGVLQRIRPLFNQIALGEPSPLRVPPPMDARGQPLPMPPGMPRLQRRSLSLSGPLRSFALFDHPPAVTAWSEVGLSLGTHRNPGAAASVLTANLQGVVYERE